MALRTRFSPGDTGGSEKGRRFCASVSTYPEYVPGISESVRKRQPAEEKAPDVVSSPSPAMDSRAAGALAPLQRGHILNISLGKPSAVSAEAEPRPALAPAALPKRIFCRNRHVLARSRG